MDISFPWHIHALGEIEISSRREWSKKHALSLFEGSVLSCPEGNRRKGRESLARSHRGRIAWLILQGEPFVLARGAYAQYVSTAKWRERIACPILKGGPFVFNIPTIRMAEWLHRLDILDRVRHRPVASIRLMT